MASLLTVPNRREETVPEISTGESAGPAAQEYLEPAEVAPLIQALHDPSAVVRAAMFEALTRLPLGPDDRTEVATYASGDIRARPGEAAAEGVPEGSMLRPAWAGGVAAGFTDYPERQLVAIREELSEVLQLDERGLPGPASLAAVRGKESEPAAVTVLFEAAGRGEGNLLLGNLIVGWIMELQPSFRPHLEGLFAEYRRQAANDVIRALRSQIGWTVSRGGLRGLISGLASHLRASDPGERIEAAHLIADACDYAIQPGAPLFGKSPASGPPAVAPTEDIAVGNGGGQRAKPPEPEPLRPSAAESASAPGEPAGARRTGKMRDIDLTREAAEREGPKPGAGPSVPRWLLAQAFDATDSAHPVVVGRAFRANSPHLVQVQIGPAREDMRRATGGPSVDDLLPDPGRPHDLVLVFVPASGNAVQAEPVTLPPRGATEMRTFTLRTGPAGVGVEAQIAVLHQNRVLQSAILRGPVVEDPAAASPEAKVELTLSVVRPGMADLDVRRPFDAAVVAGRTPDGKQGAAGVSGNKISRFDADRLTVAGTSITRALTDLADNPDAYGPALDSDGSVGLLRSLALLGAQLYSAMGRIIEEELAGEDLTRIQVLVSDPDDFLPLEFVYDLPSPTLSAGLCPNWRKALEDGRCDPSNHPTDGTGLATVVCPLGFWTLSKVIERQVVDRGSSLVDLSGKDFAVRSEPTAERSHLPGLSSALFAASDKVDSVRAGLSQGVLSTLEEVTGRNAERADTWAEWVQKVSALKPPLQVLLSHTEKVQNTLALEIGAGDLRAAGQFQGLVKPDPAVTPVVLLLGCDTAVADRQFQTFVTEFRDAGAALVVGTIAAVLGEHAAPVAQALAVALHEASAATASAGAPTFGEVMRDVRRRLLAEGELMALCLTSFGDADWQLAS
jgi:hypothetical protein